MRKMSPLMALTLANERLESPGSLRGINPLWRENCVAFARQTLRRLNALGFDVAPIKRPATKKRRARK